MRDAFYILKGAPSGQSSTVLCAGPTPSILLNFREVELVDPATGSKHWMSLCTSGFSFASTNKGTVVRGGGGASSRIEIQSAIAQNTRPFNISPPAPPGTWLCADEGLSIQRTEVVVRMSVFDVQSLAEWKAHEMTTNAMRESMDRERAKMFGAFASGITSSPCSKATISLQALEVLAINVESNRGELSGILIIEEWLPERRIRGVISLMSDTSLDLAGAS